MDPFIELPGVFPAESVDLGELHELVACDLMQAEAVDEADPQAADEGPGAAVVIVVGQVEQVDRVVGASVGIA